MAASPSPLHHDPSDEAHEAAILRQLGTLSVMTFPDNATAIHTYLTSMTHLLQTRTAFVSEVTDGTLIVRGAVDTTDSGLIVGMTLPLHETICQYVQASGLPVIVTDAAQDSRVISVAMRRRFGIGSYIGVPVFRSNGTLYGTLCAYDPVPHCFTPLHVACLRIIAQHLAAMMERTQMQQLIVRADHEATTDLLVTLDALDSHVTLMHVVAHDVRGPLMTIYNYADLLNDDPSGEYSVTHREARVHIQRASQFVNRLMNDLLDLSALKQQTLTLRAESFDAVALAHHVVASYQAEVNAKDVRLELVPLATTLPMIGDQDRLHQVLLNLLSNAVRYTDEGWIRLVVAPANEGVELQVEDSGPGIAADIQAKIWSRYERGTTSRSGFGLGLYVVQQLVHAMGGTIALESAVGHGSRFVVWLPIQGVPPQMLPWT